MKENFKNSYLLVFHTKFYDSFFYFVDLIEKNVAKIKIKFLEINFGRKKLSEITLYARTAFTRK